MNKTETTAPAESKDTPAPAAPFELAKEAVLQLRNLADIRGIATHSWHVERLDAILAAIEELERVVAALEVGAPVPYIPDDPPYQRSPSRRVREYREWAEKQIEFWRRGCEKQQAQLAAARARIAEFLNEISQQPPTEQAADGVNHNAVADAVAREYAELAEDERWPTEREDTAWAAEEQAGAGDAGKFAMPDESKDTPAPTPPFDADNVKAELAEARKTDPTAGMARGPGKKVPMEASTTLPQPREIWRLLAIEEKECGTDWNTAGIMPKGFRKVCRPESVYLADDVQAMVERAEKAEAAYRAARAMLAEFLQNYNTSISAAACHDVEAMKVEAELAAAKEERDGWHSVVTECERVLGLEGTADSPLSSNLANEIRDVKINLAAARAMIAEFLKKYNASISEDACHVAVVCLRNAAREFDAKSRREAEQAGADSVPKIAREAMTAAIKDEMRKIAAEQAGAGEADSPVGDSADKLGQTETAAQPASATSPVPALPQPREIWRLLEDERSEKFDQWHHGNGSWKRSRYGSYVQRDTGGVVRRREQVYYPADVQALVQELARQTKRAEDATAPAPAAPPNLTDADWASRCPRCNSH